MAKITLDFSSIPEDNVPDGVYTAQVAEVQLRMGRESNQPYLNWRFDIIPQTESEANIYYPPVYMMTGLSPRALWKTRDTFKALGLDPSAVSEIDVDEDSGMLVEPNFVGCLVRVKVVNETYQGTQRPRVESIIPETDVTGEFQ